MCGSADSSQFYLTDTFWKEFVVRCSEYQNVPIVSEVNAAMENVRLLISYILIQLFGKINQDERRTNQEVQVHQDRLDRLGNN